MTAPGAFQARIASGKLLLGVVHLRPLPGSPRWSGERIDEIASAARSDAEKILEAGFDGYILENFGDAPFFRNRVPPHVLTILTRIAIGLPRGDALLGVNVLRNDARGALAVAAAADLHMFRVNVLCGAMVTDQGVLEGDAARVLRERRLLAPTVAILADVDVKHGAPLGSRFDLRDAAREAARRGLADAIIITGSATGEAAAFEDLKAAREAVPEVPVLAGSGVTAATVRETLRYADGIIVGTALKEGGWVESPIDPARARELASEARR